MKKYKGKVIKSDLEGGTWIFESSDGKKYQLDGGDKGLYTHGQNVTVEGQENSGMMGIAMTGPILTVNKYTKL